MSCDLKDLCGEDMDSGDLSASWEITRVHLAAARSLLPPTLFQGPPLLEVAEFLDHNELELAMDELALLSDQFPAPPAFWEALRAAAANMGLADRERDLDWRLSEAKWGYLRVELRLLPTSEDGRKTPFRSGYRPDWDIGNSYEGRSTINGAPVTIEDRPSLLPGETGVVRLHPLVPELWTHVRPGARLALHEGARVLGTGTVLELVAPVADRDDT